MVERFVLAGFLLIVAGVLLIFIGMLAGMLRAQGEGTRVEGGGVIFIGPIPIVFGTSKSVAWYMLLAALALTVLLLATFLYFGRKMP